MREAVESAGEYLLPKSAMRGCRDTNRNMEEFIFSSGGTKRVIATLQYLKDFPTMAEAYIARSQVMDGGNYDGTKDKLNVVLVQSLKDSINMLQC